MKTRTIFASLVIFTILLAACSPASPTPQPTQVIPTPTMAASPTIVQLGLNAELGSFLVDSQGMTLYLFTKDTPNTSNCYDACAKNWPPLIDNGNIQAGLGVDSAKLGSTERVDGTKQATYNGWPLYYFAKDMKPGDTNGEEVNNAWYVISAAGDKVVPAGEESAPTATMPPTATGAPTAALPSTATLSPTATTAPVAGASAAVTISNFAFNPSPLTVKVGTTVTWTNQDGAPHKVVADNGEFRSATLGQGDTFSFTFTTEGTYNYYCAFHGGPNGQGMSGQIIVTP